MVLKRDRISLLCHLLKKKDKAVFSQTSSHRWLTDCIDIINFSRSFILPFCLQKLTMSMARQSSDTSGILILNIWPTTATESDTVDTLDIDACMSESRVECMEASSSMTIGSDAHDIRHSSRSPHTLCIMQTWWLILLTLLALRLKEGLVPSPFHELSCLASVLDSSSSPHRMRGSWCCISIESCEGERKGMSKLSWSSLKIIFLSAQQI